MRIAVAVAVCLVAIAIAVAVTLSRAPLVPARANTGLTHTELVSTREPATACQPAEALPAATSAIRLGLTTVTGPRVAVQVRQGRRVLTTGTHAPGWIGASVTVPVKPLPAAVAPVEVCFQLSQLNGTVTMLGWLAPRGQTVRSEGKALPGRIHIEYLRPSPESWLSMADSVAWRLGLGRAASGTWNGLLVLALATLTIALSSWLLIRELR